MSSTILPGADQPDEDRGPTILVAVISMTLLSLVTVCARVFVRLRMVRSFGTDDWIMIAAMVLALVGMGIVIGEVAYGAGRHAAYLDPAVNIMGLKLNFISQPMYIWAIPLVKISVGFFLLRIAPSKFYVRTLQGTMVFLIAYTFFSFMSVMLQCNDLAILWDSSVKTTCWAPKTLRTLSYVNSTVNIVTDFAFSILPIPMLWNVQINSRTKVTLICIMGLGVFACAAAIVKAGYLVTYGVTGDVLWDSANLTIWISAELNTGIMAACLPCLKPLFKRMLDSSRYGSSQKQDAYNLRGYGPATGRGTKFGVYVSAAKVGFRNKKQLGKHMSDNQSEESIISDAYLKPLEITRTTEVSIERRAAGDDDERSIGARNLSYY